MKLICRPKTWIRIPEEGKNYSDDRDLHVLNDIGEIDPRYELMCDCIDSDIQSVEGSGKTTLRLIKEVEDGIAEFSESTGNAWTLFMTRDKVWFEGLYSQGEGGEVTFNQFKFAVETYVRYLADPARKPIEVEFPQQ